MGGALHNRPSTDRRSVPFAKRIGQPTRAEPMECSTPTKVLRLAPDSVFVSIPRPFVLFFVFIFGSLGFCSFSLPLFSHKPLGAHMCNIRTHPTRYLRSQYLGASLPRSLYKTGLMHKTCVMLPHEPFIHHYMHRCDLSFGQAGLPGSCAYPYVPVCSARW